MEKKANRRAGEASGIVSHHQRYIWPDVLVLNVYVKESIYANVAP